MGRQRPAFALKKVRVAARLSLLESLCACNHKSSDVSLMYLLFVYVGSS